MCVHVNVFVYVCVRVCVCSYVYVCLTCIYVSLLIFMRSRALKIAGWSGGTLVSKEPIRESKFLVCEEAHRHTWSAELLSPVRARKNTQMDTHTYWDL
jgi:hypothetical protein